MEVIYAGLRQTASAVARTAVQEDADAIGISSMVGAHLPLVRKLMNELRSLNASDIPVIVGGIIPEEDYDPLRSLGVSAIFPPGTEVREIVRCIHSLMIRARWVAEVPDTLAGGNPDELYLEGLRCHSCGRVYFPVRRNCPTCLDDRSIARVPLSNRGTLHSFAVASVAPPGYTAPHAQGYVDLAEGGPRIFALLADYEASPGLMIGGEMALSIVRLGTDDQNRVRVGYRFRPVKEG
jgi:methylmalonyl-CoA mutase C-terminal domain/subunit